MQIRQEINIIDKVITTGSSNEIVAIDTTIPSGTVSYFFETVAKVASGTLTCNLQRTPGGTNDASTTTTQTSYTRNRSASFSPPAGITQYILNLSGGTTPSVIAARIIIFQNGPRFMGKTQTQIEIGNNESVTSSTFVSLASPKYWLYTAANWNGITTANWEVTFNSQSSKVTATAELQVDDGSFGSWAAAGGQTDQATSAGLVIRSRDAGSFTLTDGRHYRLAVKTSNSKSAVLIFNGKILINQTLTGSLTPGAVGGGNDVINGSGGVKEAVGQTFKAPSTFITDVSVSIFTSGSPIDSITCNIYDTPGGNLLASSTNSISGSSFTVGVLTICTFFVSLATTSGNSYFLSIQRTGARDISNRYTISSSKTAYADGDAYAEDSGVWSISSGDNFFIINATPVLFESQYLFLNTKSTATGLQSFKNLFDVTEWIDTNNLYKHVQDGIGAGANTKLTDTVSSIDLTNSSVTGANQQISSAIPNMPSAAHNIDSNIVAIGTEIDASRLLVVVSPTLTTDWVPPVNQPYISSDLISV